MLSPHFPRRLLGLLLLVALVAPSLAQKGDDEATLLFGYRLAGWDFQLDGIEESLSSGELDEAADGEALVRLQERAQAVLTDTEAAAAEAAAEAARVRSLLEALGPAPDDPRTVEQPRIASERERLSELVSTFETRQKQAELSATRARQLIERISTLRRTLLAEALLARGPSPLSPVVLTAAARDAGSILRQLRDAPFSAWMPRLAADQTGLFQIRLIIWSTGMAVLLYVGYRVRRWLLGRYRRHRDVGEPGYAERVKAAAAAAVARGVVPLTLAGLPLLFLIGQEGNRGLLVDSMVGALGGALIVTAVSALGRAVLAPYSVASWRLMPIADETALLLFRRIVALATIIGVATMVTYPVQRHFTVGPELVTVFDFVIECTVAVFLVLLAQRRLWEAHDDEDEQTPAALPLRDGEDDSAVEDRDRRRFWRLLRYAVMLTAMAIPFIAIAGYTGLALYLATNLSFSALVIGAVVLVRQLGRDVAALALVGEGDSTAETSGDRSAGILLFWLMAVVDLLMFALVALLLLPSWGVAWQDLKGWLLQAIRGVEIGGFTLSIGDLLAAIVLFVAILVVTRTTQRVLERRVFPQTRLDVGVRNSLKTAVGYAGLVFAIGIAVSTLGLDLSQLAIVVGALSVGIGFGLQNIVNNFVSGLILLIERPVKVGDWVVIGAHTGYVKRINVRATEIETFQLASVIIPNSELVSAALINWTHKDSYARVEVPVGVEHGSDVGKVRDTLLECGRAHARVVAWPESQVLFLKIGPSSLDFELRVFIAQADYMIQVASDLRFAIERAFSETGIRIAHPQMDVHVGRQPVRELPAERDDAPAAD